MAVFRIHKTKDYTVMSNSHFKNHDMSLKAKGMLSLMLSLPDDWDYSLEGLGTLVSDGKDSIRSALKELEKYHYLKLTRKTDASGKFDGYEYDIYEAPYTDYPFTEKPNTEKPNTEKPFSENPPQLNTNISNTKELNTKDIYIVVEYLNEMVGTNFKPTSKKTASLIRARMNEGFTVEDFKTVIYKKSKQWQNDPRMVKYLRPETLFGTKFESYLNEMSKGESSRLEEWFNDEE